jgi:hypothetical protein
MPPAGFGLLPVRSPLLRESSLFLGVLRCFSSPGALFGIAPKVPGRAPGGLPHSDIPGSRAASASPGHFAAWPRPSSAANAKASTMRPSCGFLLVPAHPVDVVATTADRHAPAGHATLGPTPVRCRARYRAGQTGAIAVMCVCSARGRPLTSPTLTPLSGRWRSPGRARPQKGSRLLPRPQNPAGSAWRLVKVHERVSPLPTGGVSPSLRSSNLVRSRLPTSDELSRPSCGHVDRRWHIVTGAGPERSHPGWSVPDPGWSRGDSNPGPPPCKGGALPAKLRPPTPGRPTPPPGIPVRRGGRAWTRTRDLGLIRAAL